MGNVHAIGPSEALVVSGGFRWPKKRFFAGAGFLWRCFVGNKAQVMSLALMTLTPLCEDAETAEGVPVTVSAVAHCKVSRERGLLELAAEQFLGRTPDEIGKAIQLTLEGHLRAILSTLTIEEVYKNRVKFASEVREVAAVDVAKMGIEIVSFNIRDVFDRVLYLRSLGKAQTAQVMKEAAIGVAEAERDAAIEESKCERMEMVARYQSYTKIAENNRNYLLHKASYDIEVNAAKAQSFLARELQVMKIQQRIKHEEIQIKIVEKRKEIEIEQHEIARKELELNATIRLRVDAEISGRRSVNHGNLYRIKKMAEGDSEKLRKVALAEAGVMQVVGTANADRRRLRAVVFQEYGDAGIAALVLEALPKIVAEVCAPLAKTEEILLMELGKKEPMMGVMSTPDQDKLINSVTFIHQLQPLP